MLLLLLLLRLPLLSCLVTLTTNQRQIDVPAGGGVTKPEAKVARIVHGGAGAVASVGTSHAEAIVTHEVHDGLRVVFTQRHLAYPDPLAQVLGDRRADSREGHAVLAFGTLVDVGHTHFT